MQKFILIRGHQGSGKSTFARKKIIEFQHDFPSALIFHIENDLLMTDEKGIYHFSPENIDKAKKTNLIMMHNALEIAQKQPQQDLLIINSNTNQKSRACTTLINAAEKFHLITEVYRLYNFYPNIHNVDENEVLAAYLRLNQNPLKNEIHVKATQPITSKQTERLKRIIELSQ